MTFTDWLYTKAEAINVTRLEISRLTGIPYRTISRSNHCKPHLDNLVILCECINTLQQGDESSFNALLIEAIKASSIHYNYAVERMEKNQ